MAEQYRNGKTVYELAPILGIDRQTVGIILRRHGVVAQDQPPITVPDGPGMVSPRRTRIPPHTSREARS
jgi:hypothetical protein